MNPKEVAVFAEEYLAEYISAFLTTLAKPTARYPMIEAAASPVELAASGVRSVRVQRLNPKLISFMLISIGIAHLLLQLAGGSHLPSLLGLTLTSILWLIFASVIHLVCRALRGRAGYWETVTISLQLFPVIYVTCALAAVIHSKISPDPAGEAQWLAFFAIQFVLFCIYLPLSMKGPHRLSWPKVIVLGLVGPPLLLVISVGLFLPIFWVPPGG